LIEKNILDYKSELYFINKDIKQKMFGIKVDYGSKFDNNWINSLYIPLGTAHFLEHMIFYKKEGHVGSKFTNYGAYANAITSYDSTIFYTTINHNSFEVIKLLVDVLLIPPNLSKKNLNIEKKVVVNEIKQKTNNNTQIGTNNQQIRSTSNSRHEIESIYRAYLTKRFTSLSSKENSFPFFRSLEITCSSYIDLPLYSLLIS